MTHFETKALVSRSTIAGRATSRPIMGGFAAGLTGALMLSLLPATPAQAAPSGQPAIKHVQVSQNATDLSARRRHYRGGNNGAAALAAFGMIAGTIATIAANEQRRDYYERRGYGYGYGYRGYGYAPPPAYGYGPRSYRYW